MSTGNKLTPEARGVIVQLLVYRMRTSACSCDFLRKAKLSEPCSRCRVMANAHDEFRDEYFTACEIIAKRYAENTQ